MATRAKKSRGKAGSRTAAKKGTSSARGAKKSSAKAPAKKAAAKRGRGPQKVARFVGRREAPW